MRFTAARCGRRADESAGALESRDATVDFQAVIDGLDALTTVAAVFDNRVAAEDFVKAVKEADLGLSINISTSVDGAEQCCFAAGIPRHSVGYSLGFEGKTEKLPNADVLLLSTMCGHGMVSHSLAKKMIDWVKEGRRTPEQAAGLPDAILFLRRVQPGPRGARAGASGSRRVATFILETWASRCGLTLNLASRGPKARTNTGRWARR